MIQNKGKPVLDQVSPFEDAEDDPKWEIKNKDTTDSQKLFKRSKNELTEKKKQTN